MGEHPFSREQTNAFLRTGKIFWEGEEYVACDPDQDQRIEICKPGDIPISTDDLYYGPLTNLLDDLQANQQHLAYLQRLQGELETPDPANWKLVRDYLANSPLIHQSPQLQVLQEVFPAEYEEAFQLQLQKIEDCGKQLQGCPIQEVPYLLDTDIGGDVNRVMEQEFQRSLRRLPTLLRQGNVALTAVPERGSEEFTPPNFGTLWSQFSPETREELITQTAIIPWLDQNPELEIDTYGIIQSDMQPDEVYEDLQAQGIEQHGYQAEAIDPRYF